MEGTDGVADGVREADEAVAPWGRWGRCERETAPVRRSSVGKMGAAAWGRVSRNGRRGEAAPGAVEKKLLRRLGEVGVPCGVVWGDRVCLFLFSLFYGVQPLFFSIGHLKSLKAGMRDGIFWRAFGPPLILWRDGGNFWLAFFNIFAPSNNFPVCN